MSSISRVIGKKSDAADNTVGIIASMVSYIKGLLNVLNNVHDTDLPAVKTDTEELLSYARQGHYGVFAVSTNATSSYTDTVNITDKGILQSLSVSVLNADAEPTATIGVTIDGGTIKEFTFIGALISSDAAGLHDYYYGERHITCNIPFATSLRVQTKGGTVRALCCYTTD